MKPWVVWAVGVTLLVVAWGVTKVTPGAELTEASFVTPATIGERALGSELALTIDEVVIASTVSDARGWTAEGQWLIVDLQMSAQTTEEVTSLSTAILTVDGKMYQASERPQSLFLESLGADIVTTGSVAFELPAGADSQAATLRFAPKAGDVRLDSVIELSFDLGDLSHERSRELRPTVGGGL